MYIERNQSLLDQVRCGLALDEDLVVVGETIQTTPQNDEVETIGIFVRPDQDLGFDGDKLYKLQRQVIDPILHSLFRQSYKYKLERSFYGGTGTDKDTTLDLQFGYHSLNEIIGHRKLVGRIILDLFDKEAQGRFVAAENEELTFESRAATRTIKVYILPNDSIAKLVLAYEEGLNQGMVVQNRTLDSLKHGLTAEQIRMAIAGENPFPEIRYKNS